MKNPLALETIRRQGIFIVFGKNTKKRCAFHDILKNFYIMEDNCQKFHGI